MAKVTAENSVMLSNFEQKIIDTAKELLSKGPTSTLDIKLKCRELYSDRFYQTDVSDVMSGLGQIAIPNLVFTDNGKYRIYSINDTTPRKSKVVHVVSKTKLVELIKNSKGKFFTITFIKKDGEERTVNAHVKQSNLMNNLGYIQIKTGKNEIKLVDPKRILKLEIEGMSFVSKKHV